MENTTTTTRTATPTITVTYVCEGFDDDGYWASQFTGTVEHVYDDGSFDFMPADGTQPNDAWTILTTEMLRGDMTIVQVA